MAGSVGALCYHSSVLAVADTFPAPNDARVSFLAFLYSLAGSAAVHFGDVADPATGEKRPPNIEQAGHVIEVMAMLEQKTKGNLTAEERQFLETVLYELRMRFVALKGPSGRP
jgi:hypothetical protein